MLRKYLNCLVIVSGIVVALGFSQAGSTTHFKAPQGPENGKPIVSSANYEAPKPAPPAVASEPIKPPVTYPSDHVALMTAAGIAPDDFGAVEYIVGHENRGWEPTRYNTGGSGAYGLCQALPGYKMASAGDDWETNPITQLRWCDGYAKAVYGGWWPAQAFWASHQLW